ncbi:MAG: acyltransferase [Lachnospiraceae bacterium]|nr:acyltransferase [Lachnospiraceae bacterium]
MKRSARIICNGRMEIYTGCDIWIGEGATLKLGTGYFNNGVQVVCFKSIRMGNNVIVGPNVVIRDSDAHHLDYSEHKMTKRVVIEDDVWIGCGAMILKGVTIGKGSVVSAGAVVTKDVPPHSLVGGIPVKVIRENIKWGD